MTEAKRTTEREAPARARVFVVDGDPGVRASMESLLRTLDVDVLLYATAEEFLGDFKDGGPACLISEVRLSGMSGFQLLQRLKENGTELPVIFLASEGDVAMAVHAMKSGAVDFLEKPFVEGCLISHLRKLLGEPAG